ncbi:MAG: endonuclease/exonuclease/phosphatase family protein [Polyangiaceae bacterium]
MNKRFPSILGWSVATILMLAACSDSGDGGGSGGSRGGSGGSAQGGTGGSGGSGKGGTGGAAGSTGGAAGASGGTGGSTGGAAGSTGGTGGTAGKGGTGGAAGSGTGGAAGSGAGGAAGTGGSKDAGAPDGSTGGSAGSGGAGGSAGTGGAAGSSGSGGGGPTDARIDTTDAGTGGTGGSGGDAAPPMCSPLTGGAPIHVTVPPKGTASSLDIGGWNIEWFGATGNGPTDKALQRDNVADVLLGTDMDLWGLEEVVSTAQFNEVMAKLPGYKGFLSDNALVTEGSQWYTASEQKVGFVYKCSVATVQSAKIILTSANTPFAGRPPLEVTLKVTLNGSTMDLVVIVLHAKCCDDTDSWQRRKDASDALKTYLDTTYPTQNVIVVGDFNDDLDMSITSGSPSPYANFLSDTAKYTFVSKALTDMKIPTTGGFPTAIDHHLATNELAGRFISGSVTAYTELKTIITGYNTTTTDHYPVLSRYNLP